MCNNTILTYNIQRMPTSVKPLKNLYGLVKSYSIVLLQECFLNIMYDDIQYTFRDYHIVKGTMMGYRLVNSGLVILSRYPVLSYQFVPFKTQNYLSSDILAEKGFLMAVVSIDNTPVCIVNTHLQSNTYRGDYAVAKQQCNELYAYMNEVKHPWIIGGDFNTPFQTMESPYTLYAPTRPTIYIKYVDDVEQDTSCYKTHTYEPFVFDYFMSQGIRLSEPSTLDFWYSDHLPVGTKFFRMDTN